MDTDLQQAAGLLRTARRVVVFTGAGISAESGVPTFRDDLTGLWSRFNAEHLATPEAFHADPDLVWGWYEWRRSRVRHAEPNPGHLAVTAITRRVPGAVVVTQNVDDLHERAGSPEVTHLHGSLFAPRCVGDGAHPATFPDATQNVAHDESPSGEPADGRRIPPPLCVSCGALVRPGVVWFGEELPGSALTTAAESAAASDLFLTVGTSGMVYPAAEIPRIAVRAGAAVIQVNPQPTQLDLFCTINLLGTAAHVLPAIVAAAWPPSTRG
ncbi:SIR2 family NAD-dependent protein deacylase [Virgisporangium aurantiacum]|uniref:NAD-dependent protein deacylase n=1 Tax=Virgisporangium aurantiacum TaxID=175570 RepID=A0A8J4E9U8_9ACTN|nr:NAD-dependent protein deacylase [Virgisporangium aurantiacum]GIJ64107.1 NAD-dependent protein deacylase 1 [Virgisporangium aurantiacum]